MDEQPISFEEMLSQTGLERAQAIVLCHKAGISIFGQTMEDLRLTTEQVQLILAQLSQSLPAEAKQKRNKKGRQTRRQEINQARTRRQSDRVSNNERPRSPAAMAKHFEIPLETVLDICRTHAIEFVDPKNDLRNGPRQHLENLLSIEVLNKTESDRLDPIHDSPSSIPFVVSKSRATKNIPSARIGRASTKRILVLARETGATESDIRFVMLALGIPAVGEDDSKFATKHESDLTVALSILPTLPTDRLERGQVRVREIAESKGLSLHIVQEFCRSKGIDLSHGKYARTEDAVKLAWLLTNGATVARLRRATETIDPTQTMQLTDQGEVAHTLVIDYRGVDLSRQEFTEFHFNRADMTEVDLSFCQMSRATLDSTVLVDASLIRATCTGATFRSTNCTGADFERARLEFSDFSNANLQNANFEGSILRGAIFAGANLTNARISITEDDIVVLNQTTWTDGRVIDSIEEIFVGDDDEVLFD